MPNAPRSPSMLRLMRGGDALPSSPNRRAVSIIEIRDTDAFDRYNAHGAEEGGYILRTPVSSSYLSPRRNGEFLFERELAAKSTQDTVSINSCASSFESSGFHSSDSEDHSDAPPPPFLEPDSPPMNMTLDLTVNSENGDFGFEPVAFTGVRPVTPISPAFFCFTPYEVLDRPTSRADISCIVRPLTPETDACERSARSYEIQRDLEHTMAFLAWLGHDFDVATLNGLNEEMMDSPTVAFENVCWERVDQEDDFFTSGTVEW